MFKGYKKYLYIYMNNFEMDDSALYLYYLRGKSSIRRLQVQNNGMTLTDAVTQYNQNLQNGEPTFVFSQQDSEILLGDNDLQQRVNVYRDTPAGRQVSRNFLQTVSQAAQQDNQIRQRRTALIYQWNTANHHPFMEGTRPNDPIIDNRNTWVEEHLNLQPNQQLQSGGKKSRRRKSRRGKSKRRKSTRRKSTRRKHVF